MDILEQCQKWHEEERFDKIINALDDIDPSERSPEMDSELARALNNFGVRNKNGSYMLDIAITLLKKHEELMGESYLWNYRMGYAHYFLDKKGPALKYFMKASEIEPEDEDCDAFISNCIKRLTLPIYARNFRTRVLMAWLTFADQEKEIRRLLGKKNKPLDQEEAHVMAFKIFRYCMNYFEFSIGFNGGKYEITFSPLGNSITLLELSFLKQHAPEAVLKHWDIVIGRAATNDNHHMVGDVELSNDELQLWLSEDNGKLKISAYCPKLKGVMANSFKAASKVVEAIIYTAIGEIAYMRYVRELELLDEPKADKHILLCDLQKELSSMGCDLNIDAQQYLETNFDRYTRKVDEEPSKIWRDDIVAGSTCVPELIEGYFNDDESAIDKLHDDGVAAGFIAYSLDSFDGDDRTDKIFAFREAFEEYLSQDGLDDVVKVVGGATGVDFGYVDVLVWDLVPFLDAAKAFFDDSKIEHAVFHAFRKNVGTVTLKKAEADDEDQEQINPQSNDDGICYAQDHQAADDADNLAAQEQDEVTDALGTYDDAETGSFDMTEQANEPSQELIYDPQHPQAFYAQIDEFNDDDEYLKSIAALESVDRKYWDFNHAYLLVRALQNYAIIGDQLDKTSSYKGDQALLRSLKLLKEFQAQGKKEARWHMRMAYGYQYLYGQEEQAIAYAKTWAELDPQDEDAKRVINECQEQIEKRSAPLIDIMDEFDEPDDSEDGEVSSVNRKGQFVCSILLDKLGFDKDALLETLKTQWSIVDEPDDSVEAAAEAESDAEAGAAEDCDGDDGADSEAQALKDDIKSEALVIRQGKMFVAISYMPCKVPQKDIMYAAENNYMWPDAHKAAKQHKAHILIAVVGQESELMDRAMVFAKVAAACCALKSVSAVFFNNVIIQKEFYADMANLMKDDILPLNNWIWFGLYKNKNGLCAYTYGLDLFGKEEIEVLDAACEPAQLRDFIYDLANYVIAYDVTLQDGETIGFSATDKHAITRSDGVALPGQQTLKVEFFKNAKSEEEQDEIALSDE